MNDDVKSMLLSKTLWGVLIAALPTVLSLFGYKVGDVVAFTEASNLILDNAVALGGSALAIYGRIVATKALVIKK